jgi:virulence factor Mce-like protein
MTTQSPRPAAVAVAILFALSCFLLTVFVWSQFGGSLPFRPAGYRFHAPFAQGSQLTPNADVRISGVPVGKVITIKPRGGRTDAVIELQRQFAPIPADAHAILRSKTLLGETFVELTPGSPKAPKLREGATLSVSQIEPTQQLDQVLSAFDGPTRASFKRFLSDFSTALEGRGPDINAALGNAAPAVDNLSVVVAVLDRQQPAVQGLIRDAGTTLRALGSRDSDLQSLITAGNEVLSATAARDGELTATVQALPTFLRELRGTLASAEATAGDAAPTLRALRPVAPLVRPALAQVNVLAPQARAVFRNLDPVITISQRALPAATRIVNAANALADVLYPASRDLVPTIDIITTFQQDIIATFANVGATFQGADATGTHYLRALIPITNEGPIGYTQRLPSNRHNPYFTPGGLAALSPGPLPAFDCRNTGNPPGTPVLGPGGPPPCLVQEPWNFQGHTRAFPHVERAH